MSYMFYFFYHVCLFSFSVDHMSEIKYIDFNIKILGVQTTTGR